jgi:hypothetical protein
MRAIPRGAQVFAAFSFLLAAIALFTFWPPTSRDVVLWLVLWVGVCVATGTAILRRHRRAPLLVWALIAMGMLSALTALRSGMLDATGIAIDIALFTPMIGFAIWYQRNRRMASDRDG